MAVETNECEFFGSGGFHGTAGSTGSVVVTPAGGPPPNETYCAELGFEEVLASNVFAASGVMVTAFWVRFSDTTDITGGEASFMQCRDSVTAASHWIMTWKDGGLIRVYDDDNNVITQIGGILKDKWYLIEVRWERGDPQSMTVWWTREWSGYSRFLSGTFGGFDLEAGNADLQLYFASPFSNVAANTLHVKSWYNRINSTCECDLLGKFEGLTYVTDHASTVRDLGDTDPTDQWVKGADIPFGGAGGNMDFFSGFGNDSASATRVGNNLFGPGGDPLVTGRIFGIKGTWDGRRWNKKPIIGRWDGSAGSYTTGGTVFAGGNISLVLDGAHANCPATDEYCAIGVASQDFANTVSVVDMCATVLHVAAKPITLGTLHGGREVVIAG